MAITGSIKKALGIPSLIFRINNNIQLQKKFLIQNVKPVLSEFMSVNDGSLTEKDIQKINQYYGLGVPAVLGESFCILRGYPMTGEERWAATCQGAMTGLFDDFFDMQYMEDAAIEDKIYKRERSKDKRTNELLFDLFYDNVLNTALNPTLVRSALKEVYFAQVASREQLSLITNERLKEITFLKGGTSLQFYRTVFSHPYLDGEDSMLFFAGSVMQLGNDIFDIYKDRESGIHTLVSDTDHIRDLRTLFKGRLNEFYSVVRKLDYPTANKERFIDILSVCIFSRCLVCLQHLENNERTTNNQFMVQKYNRQQLICDMDTKKNMLRSAAYHIQTAG